MKYHRVQRKIKLISLLSVFILVVIINSFVNVGLSSITWYHGSKPDGGISTSVDIQTWKGRHLLQSNITPEREQSLLNCTPRAIYNFPPDFMTEDQRKHGGVLFHLFITCYLFCALAIVCDDYFVPSLEKMCDVLNMQTDVAGATFMAAGSSAPELFTAIIGVFFAKSDVGVGTIVGSAVFNVLFINAICGLFAGMVIYLTWWPLVRDSVCYCLSIIALIAVMHDEIIHWYEGLALFVMYILYCVMMYFNRGLGNYVMDKVDSWTSKGKVDAVKSDLESSQPLLFENGIDSSTPRTTTYGTADKESVKENEESTLSKTRDSQDSSLTILENTDKEPLLKRSTTPSDISVVVTHTSPLSPPNGKCKRFYWGLMLPVSLLLVVTVPDCQRPGCWQKTYALAFFMSIIWIAGFSYLMVWMVTIAGDTLGIPDTVMGLTLLAAGTSVPDAMSSLIVAREGLGDMAVSNAIGSNVFDILLCLGLPWLLQTGVVSPDSVVPIDSAGLTYSTITLLGTVVFLLVALFLNKWRLNKPFGLICILAYIIVVTFSCLYELNVFGYMNPPSCP